MKNTEEICVLVFSGYNPRAVYAFLRTLDKNNIKYAVIAKSEQDSILFTKYKEKVLYIRKTEKLEVEDVSNAISYIRNTIGFNKLIIAPSTEALNRFMLIYRTELEEIGCIIPLVEQKLYEMISDKASFGMLCTKEGILTPREIEVAGNEALPIVAKPKQYCSKISGDSLSPVIIMTEDELNNFKLTYNEEDFYYQEYVWGRSIYLLYYFDKNGTCYKYSQENFIQQPEGKSIVAAISGNYHTMNLSSDYEKLFHDLNYRGFVMIEVRQYNDKYYMIEANPRFWGPSQLFVDAGMNFFEVFLYDYHLIDKSPILTVQNNKTKYFWLGGIIETFRKNLKLVYYNDNEGEFFAKLSEWISCDIYNRTDTDKIFQKEWGYE